MALILSVQVKLVYGFFRMLPRWVFILTATTCAFIYLLYYFVFRNPHDLFIKAVKAGDLQGVIDAIKVSDDDALRMCSNLYNYILLQWGVDINKLDDRGVPPLTYAVDEGHKDITLALLAAGAKVLLDSAHARIHERVTWQRNRWTILTATEEQP